GGAAGGAASVGANVAVAQAAARRDLQNVRVVQRNLVFLVGIPPALATEDTLRRPEYLGQYGRLQKIVAHPPPPGGDPRVTTASAYVTFANRDDARACILALDGFFMEGRQVRASYGTARYCHAFLRGAVCTNPDCLYLHELGDEEDRLARDEIQSRALAPRPLREGTPALTGGGGPSGTGKRCVAPVLPPPTFEADTRTAQRAGRAAVAASGAAAAAAGGSAVVVGATAGGAGA
ncbi:unnamed protein product, partial [Phaeothamnion confervicola]